jgi:lysozyme
MRSLSGVCVLVAFVALSACVNQEPMAAATAEPKAASAEQPAPPAQALAEKSEAAAPAAEAEAKESAPAQAAAVETPKAAAPTTAVAATAKPAPVASARQHFTNAKGLAIIKESEGLRLEAYSYAGQWLVGYGHSATAKPGMKITEAQAEDLLRQDLGVCEKAIGDAVSVPVSSNEFSAMVSLCYNIGWQNFVASSVVRRLNAGDREGAGDAFLMWTKATVNGQRVSLPHLEERRARERALFLDPGESA